MPTLIRLSLAAILAGWAISLPEPSTLQLGMEVGGIMLVLIEFVCFLARPALLEAGPLPATRPHGDLDLNDDREYIEAQARLRRFEADYLRQHGRYPTGRHGGVYFG